MPEQQRIPDTLPARRAMTVLFPFKADDYAALFYDVFLRPQRAVLHDQFSTSAFGRNQ